MDVLDKARCKAARALLDWTAGNLAERAGVSIDTLRSFESGRSRTLSRENEAALLRAFEAAGIRMLRGGDIASGPGVSLQVPPSDI